MLVIAHFETFLIILSGTQWKMWMSHEMRSKYSEIRNVVTYLNQFEITY